MKKNNKNKLAFSLIELSVVILVIGILVIGVSKGSVLVKAAQIKTAQSLTRGSPILSIEGLTLWLESSGTDESSIVNSSNSTQLNDGDRIISWHEFNPSASDKKILTSPAVINYPTYSEQGMNGLPSIHFQGSPTGDQEILQIGNIEATKLFKLDEATIFIVMNMDASSHFATIFNWGGDSNRVLAHLVGPNRVIWDFGDVTNGRADYTAPNNNFFIDQPHIFSFTRKINGVLNVNLDGTTIPGGLTNATATPSGSNAFILGAPKNIGNNYNLIGDISEVIIYNEGLSDNDRTIVEKYLSNKWSIKLD
jgi:prepilin-type N-terminal cleavage/methylation domain-containing protein